MAWIYIVILRRIVIGHGFQAFLTGCTMWLQLGEWGPRSVSGVACGCTHAETDTGRLEEDQTSMLTHHTHTQTARLKD